MHFLTNNAKETAEAGYNFGKTLKASDIVLFKGEMGAGKTHFTKGIGKALGIEDEITSPTFALVNEYFGKIPLFHFDLFRINSFDDLYATGFFDYPERGGVIAVEWSENVSVLETVFENEFTGTIYTIEINKTSDETREINIKYKRQESNS